MASTKIINVSKTDSFEDVFSTLKAASAEEVILIFPKSGSKFAKQKSYLASLTKEAERSGKVLSIMTEDPIIEELAEEYGLNVLEKKKTASRPRSAAQLPVAEYAVARNVALEDGEDIEDEDSEESDEPIAVAAVARRTMDDIVTHKTTRPLKVKRQGPESYDIDVRKETEDFFSRPEEGNEKIEEVWAGHRPSRKKQTSKGFSLPDMGLGSHGKKLAGTIGVALVGIAATAYFLLGSAQVTVTAAKQDVDVKINIVSSPTIASVHADRGEIPGQKFVVSKEVSQAFPLTGEKNVVQKAHGTIKIFNKSVNQPQRLVATTRFQSPDGLIFRIPQTVLVPGAVKLAGGNVEPGSVEVAVQADRPGPEYNIPPSNFTVPGFKSLPQYEQVSAISTGAMIGGFIGLSKVVSESDYAKAVDTLTPLVKSGLEGELKQQIADLTVIDQGNTIIIDKPIVNAEAGDAAPELIMKLRASHQVIAYRSTDLDLVIADYLKKKGGLTVRHGTIEQTFENISYDQEKGQLSFVVHLKGRAAATIDESGILNDLPGLNQEQIQAYFQGIKEVESVKVMLAPFWVTRIPKDQDRLKLTVE